MESGSSESMDGYDVVERSSDYLQLNRYLRRLRGERLFKLRFHMGRLTLHLGPPHLDLAGQREGIPRGSFVVEAAAARWRLEAPDACFDDLWIDSRGDPDAARREVEAWADDALGLAVHEVEAAPPPPEPDPLASRPVLRMLLASDDAFVVAELDHTEGAAGSIWELATPFDRRLFIHTDGTWDYREVER